MSKILDKDGKPFVIVHTCHFCDGQVDVQEHSFVGFYENLQVCAICRHPFQMGSPDTYFKAVPKGCKARDRYDALMKRKDSPPFPDVAYKILDYDLEDLKNKRRLRNPFTS